MAYLKPLNQIISPELISYDRDNLVQELVDRITIDPNWNSIWDGELLQNFAYFIINTFAYLFEKNAEHANRIIKEAFVISSKDPQSLINYLSNYNLSLKQNTASIATVRVRPSDGSSFTKYFTLPAGTVLPAIGYSGNTVNYELYLLENNGKINYRSPLEILPSNYINFIAYSGETITETYSLNSNLEREKFIYNIVNSNIIENSLRIYYEYNTLNEVELIQTDSFVVTPIINNTFTTQLGGIPHYKILYNTDGTASILFGTARFGGSFPPSGGNLTFIYRVGGGSTSNVSAGGINYTTTVPVDNFTSLSINFFNILGGGSGSDREDIDEARFYAPHRVGRGRSIIDDRDALNALYNSCIKHKVLSPKYNTYSVPVLHYHNHIVPYRDFNDFIFPIPESNDTAESYRTVFEQAINDYCNLQGLHDGIENDILISYFRATNFSFPLPLKPILNSSLSVSAYDKEGTEIDRLIFSGNYANQNENYPDEPEIKASITSNAKIPAIGVTSNNNTIRFKLDTLPSDYIVPDGSTVKTEEYFEITIPIGTYSLDSNGFNTILAQVIDNAIRNSDTYYSSFSSSIKFAYLNSDGKLIISSPSSGEISSVQLFVPSNSILNTLGFISEKVYAEPQNRKIFLQTSFYDSDKQEVYISLNNSSWNASDLKYNLVPTWASGSIMTGPTISFNLTDLDGNVIYPQEGTSITIEAIQNSQVNDTLFFSNITSTTNTFGATNIGTVFDDANPDICFFEYSTGTITLKLTDSNGVEGEYSYPREDDNETEYYNMSTIFRISYSKKPYQFITTSFNPNPYHNEGEALGFSELLNSSNKKQIGVEPLIKKVNFIPYGIEAFVKPTTGYTRQQAINSTLTQIYTNFSYNNTNSSLNIGEGLIIQNLISILNNKIILPEVQRIRFTLPSEDFSDTVGNAYYFIIPENFLNRIINFEGTYTQITGLNNYYNIRVVAE